MCSFNPSVAARQIVQASPTLRYTSSLAGRHSSQPTDPQLLASLALLLSTAHLIPKQNTHGVLQQVHNKVNIYCMKCVRVGVVDMEIVRCTLLVTTATESVTTVDSAARATRNTGDSAAAVSVRLVYHVSYRV